MGVTDAGHASVAARILDRPGRMADDDPEPDDAGRAAVCGYAESKGGHVVGFVGAEAFGKADE